MPGTENQACKSAKSLLVSELNEENAPTLDEPENENPESEPENLAKEESGNANGGELEISNLSSFEYVQQLLAASSSDEGSSTSSHKEQRHPPFRSSQMTHSTEFSGSDGHGSGGSISSDESEPHVTPKQVSGFVQTLALLRKNLLTRYRTPTGTFFELFSPLMMLLILASAYTLSEITYKDAKMYSSITFDIPGPWLDLVQSSSSLLSNEERRDIRSRQLLRQEEQSSTEEWDGETDWNDVFTGLQDKVHRKLLDNLVEDPQRRKLQSNDDDNVDDNAEESGSGFGDVYDLLDEARRQISKVLKGPLPVPSFSQYVGASTALSSAIGVDDLPRIISDSSFGRQWGNLLTLGTIHLSPNNTVANSFVDYLKTSYPVLWNTSLDVRVHENEAHALKFINKNLNERTWALLDFTDGALEEDDFRYKIRMNYTTVPNTNEITNFVSIGLNTDYQMYYLSGYLTLQRTLNEFVFSQDEACADMSADLSSLWSMPMPTAAYSQNPFFLEVGFLLGLSIVMAFLYPTSRLIKSIVEEKESRMKETLFILGLKGWAHWLSWFITAIVVFFIITITVTAAMTNTFVTYSDSFYIFLLVGLFSTATIGFCFTLAAMFSRAKLAAIIGPMALFATILPRFIFFGFNQYEATTGKRWASLFPATAFAFAADIIGDYEYSQQGIQEWNAWEGSYSFNTALGLLFFDTILYIFLGWYLEQVMPRQYGVARPFYFLFTPKYWTSFFWSEKKSRAKDVMVGESPNDSNSSEDIEKVTDPRLRPRVQIENLVKQYTNNSAVSPAVDNLNLTLYESQITALLGHNGAGKTSTVSVLTGLYPPTSGDCILYGKSIVNDSMEARQSIGICPQHNVLFDSLTVYEHLAFFMRIKGIRPSDAKIRGHAVEIGLSDYLRTPSAALSGGNKRKLSVAIALSGDPSVLILDEPTSAMDPHSRRAVWELLRAKRNGRVTLLTTHFMDEAELLSDRIAVMKEGKLQCLGSAMFLKNRFGLGYNLTVVLEPIRASSDEDDASANSVHHVNTAGAEFESQRDRLSNFLMEQIPGTVLIRSSGKELTFRFPQGTEKLFPAAFDALELQQQSLGVGAYGVRNSSLEEVFLQLADNKDDAGEDVTTLDTEGDKPRGFVSIERETRDEIRHLSPLQQVGLLYFKRFTIQKRDMKGAFFTVIVPVVVVALVLLVLMIEPPFVGPAIEVNPSMYRKSSVTSNAKTNVLIGGGASKPSGTNVTEKYALLSDALDQHYEYVDLDLLENAQSSADMSRFLLETINDRDHHIRFGAYAVEDSINANIRFQLSDLAEDVFQMASFSLGDTEAVNLIDILNLGGADGKIKWNVSVDDLASSLYDGTSLSPASELDANVLQGLTSDAIQAIFSSRPNSNASSSVDEWVQELKYVIDGNDLDIDPNTADLLSNLANITVDWIETLNTEIQDSNLTTEEISERILDWYKAAVVNITHSGTTVNYLEQWVQDGFDDIAELLQADTSATDLSEVAIDFFNNFTEFLALANSNVANTTLADISRRVDDFLEVEGSFQRAIVKNELGIVLDGAIKSLGLEPVLNVSDSVSAAFDYFDLLSSQIVETAEAEDFSNTLVVGLMALADDFLLQLIERSDGNSTLRLSDVFGDLSEALGGSRTLLDGSVLVEASSLVFNIPSMTLSLSGLSVHTLNETLLEIEDADFNLSIGDLASIAPDGTLEVTFQISTRASILHNSSSPHAIAAFNQAYSESLYGTCKANIGANLISVNEPLPLTTQQSIEVKTILSILATMFLLIPYCYIPGAFIVFIVKERISKSKHLQLVSGVNMTSYWAATYLWDLTLFFILTVAVMIVFLIYGAESAQVFVGDTETFFASMALTFGYGMSILPFAYLFARNFDNPSSAQISVIGVIFITGFVAINAYFIMSTIDNTEDIADSLQPLFRMWPAFNVGEGFIQLASSFWEREILGSEKRPFDWDVTGRSLVLLYSLAPVYFLILLLLEYSEDGGSGGVVGRSLRYARGSYERMMLRWYGVRKSGNSLLLDDGLDESNELDEDVRQEESYVKSNPRLQESAPVVLRDLWKIYPPSEGILGAITGSIRKLICCICVVVTPQNSPEDTNDRSLPRRAVRGLTTCVKEGETLGLLGANGAGKTTTLGVLTGDIAPTGGEAFVASHDISGVVPGGVAAARKHIGFCPQTDPLLDLMTGRETLTMFAKLRGIPNAKVAEVVDVLIDRLTLRPHADKNAGNYSGGNKRKLSLGIAALVGDGGVLLVDECSSGLDPLAKKKLWGLIEQLSLKRSVILTTHSMEEAEALCTRIGIMARGRLVAIGSVQHLKTKYVDGYTIDINCRSNTPDHIVSATIVDVLETVVPGSRLSEHHGRFLKFDVPRVSALGLGTTFKRLQELKASGDFVEDYSISQCSLEQVFIKLVNEYDHALDANDDNEGAEPLASP